MKEQFVGAKVKAIQGEDPSVTKVNYFKDRDPDKWETDISTYGMVNLGEIYEGIDLRLKAYGNNVEKLFCVKPDADPEQIKISLSGVKDCGVQNAECGKNTPLSRLSRGDKSEFQNLSPTPIGDLKLSVNECGELEVETELGPVKFTKPVAYQEINGRRVDVECKYTIADCGMQNEAGSRKQEVGSKKVEARSEKYALLNPKSAIRNSKSEHPHLEYGFKVASYDRTKDLIIDPLLASTYLGGPYEDRGKSIAVDADGNVFVAGETLSSEFPTTPGAYCPSRKGNTDVFVSKFNSGLTSLLASTFLGGSFNHERTYSIAIDAGGNIYVTGATYSTNFPTTDGAYATAYNSGTKDVFVSKFNSKLTSLPASTLLGGQAHDYGRAIAIDAGGNVYVTGSTSSTDFPTTHGAYDTTSNGGSDVFVSKFSSGLTNLLMSTFQGGSRPDCGNSIAVSAVGRVYVTGETVSPDFPATPGAYNTSYYRSEDVFVSGLNVDPSADKGGK